MADSFPSIGPRKIVFWAHLVMCSLGMKPEGVGAAGVNAGQVLCLFMDLAFYL